MEQKYMKVMDELCYIASRSSITESYNQGSLIFSYDDVGYLFGDGI